MTEKEGTKLYKIELRKVAVKQLDKINDIDYNKIRNKIFSLKENPRPYGSKKLTGETGYRIRIGDFRILYEIDNASKTITIYRIGHRNRIYR